MPMQTYAELAKEFSAQGWNGIAEYLQFYEDSPYDISSTITISASGWDDLTFTIDDPYAFFAAFLTVRQARGSLVDTPMSYFDEYFGKEVALLKMPAPNMQH